MLTIEIGIYGDTWSVDGNILASVSNNTHDFISFRRSDWNLLVFNQTTFVHNFTNFFTGLVTKQSFILGVSFVASGESTNRIHVCVSLDFSIYKQCKYNLLFN